MPKKEVLSLTGSTLLSLVNINLKTLKNRSSSLSSSVGLIFLMASLILSIFFNSNLRASSSNSLELNTASAMAAILGESLPSTIKITGFR